MVILLFLDFFTRAIKSKNLKENYYKVQRERKSHRGDEPAAACYPLKRKKSSQR
jgi:hypothetical protein